MSVDVNVLCFNYTNQALSFNEPVTFARCVLTSLTGVGPRTLCVDVFDGRGPPGDQNAARTVRNIIYINK